MRMQYVLLTLLGFVRDVSVISVYSNVNDAHMVTCEIQCYMKWYAANCSKYQMMHYDAMFEKKLQFAVLRRAMTPELSLHGQHGSTTSHQGPTPGKKTVDFSAAGWTKSWRSKKDRQSQKAFVYIYIYIISISNACLSVQDVAWCSVILSIAIIRSRSSRRSIMMISFFISFFIISSSYRTIIQCNIISSIPSS